MFSGEQVAQLLVEYSGVCRKWFVKWCSSSKNEKHKKKHLAELWPVILTTAVQMSKGVLHLLIELTFNHL